ncbi:homeobox-leucine zipper protein ATHB-52-like [Impatiens glandulifera]|uniref:homeobox-leucine zipper protein ATHB-52-like n=1 Tax=Impatiens glandulifera TaxID=253017 RepID=UPI001FB164AE|nr:homeobox-leucine zipper protein ATHB-52-like [Impatiens glandulifera]
MNHIHYSNGRKSQPKINNKKRLTEDQVRLLETSFNFNNKLDPDQKLQLAMELGISSRRVAVWYQNKRARWKSQSLEDDHRTIKMRLESVLTENERLEREVVRLRHDLDKAHDILV